LIARLLHRQLLSIYGQKRLLPLSKYLPKHVRKGSTRGRAHGAYLLRCPRSSVPEGMRACKFTLDESENRSKQMTIRRSLAAQNGKLAPPPNVIDTMTAATTTVSPLTNQMSSVRGGPSISLILKWYWGDVQMEQNMCPEEQDSARYSTLLYSQKMSYTYNMYSQKICTLSGLLATNDAYFVESLYWIRQYGRFLRNQKRKYITKLPTC
jgi:hypothetical protein